LFDLQTVYTLECALSQEGESVSLKTRCERRHPKRYRRKTDFPERGLKRLKKGSIVTAFHARLMIGEVEKRKKTDHGRRSEQ
jgi:hypothetical protein